MIKPGNALVSVISAMPGGIAERVVRAMACCDGTEQFSVEFKPQDDSSWMGTFRFVTTGEERKLTLRLGVKEGLFLEDYRDLCSCSMKGKYQRNGNGDVWVLSVGQYAKVAPTQWKSGVRRQYTEEQIKRVARNILGTWVLHGGGWVNRKGVACPLPYGDDNDRGRGRSLRVDSSTPTVTLGGIREMRTLEIRSILAPFKTFPNYMTAYPEVVVSALAELYQEYNRAFKPLVSANREWPDDYQYCVSGGLPVNWCVQVDMVGLDDEVLRKIKEMRNGEAREMLRRQIFEIENSIAMYQLLERGCSPGVNFRQVLAHIRQTFGRPIALLAVTYEKQSAMRQIEFGKRDGEDLSDQEVSELTGFDTFFGPDEFLRHLGTKGDKCDYLLYVRSSDPVAKLKDPTLEVSQPLLATSSVRKIIKANTLTFNIDAPGMDHSRRINDTKDYMPSVRMGFMIRTESDLDSPTLGEYCRSIGVDPDAVRNGQVVLRAKPAKGTYGCYGHISGKIDDGAFRRELRAQLGIRGPYIVQPEVRTPVVANSVDGTPYTFIDRVFLGMIAGQPKFLGGVRNLMPLNTAEAANARIHGNGSAVYAGITC